MKISKSIKINFLIILLIGLLGSCELPKKKDNFVKLNLLQVNDVYEIEAIENGKYGGMARVATLKKELQKANPNTWMVLSGDFINPSVYGTLEFEGEPIKGKQMIDAMNAAKVDFVTFGNHEFDVHEHELLSRLNESEFEWIATNAFHKQDSLISSFVKVQNEKEIPCPTYKIVEIKAENGKIAKMGIIGLTITSNKKEYVHYKDLKKSTQEVCDVLKDKCDFIVAITHLVINDDINIAGDFPQISLLMGGHEHENHIQRVGQTTIAKADANAKTAYIHRLKYDFETKTVTVDSELKKIDESIPDDPETKVVVDKWASIAETSFKSSGFHTEDIILELDTAIDARDITTRGRQCAVGEMITSAMADAWSEADVITLGGGSIRVDDYILGNITEYDILRMLPFGGKTVLVEMKGELLIDFLSAGKQNKGSGGYLQLKNATFDETKNAWLVQEKEIDLKKSYKVGMNSYLISGLEANMSFMTAENPLILNVETPSSSDSTDIRHDIRQVLINYLKTHY
jgi:2',3'-cyclic-nucleotide 2'-phosphodiesterase (5'-nucleotidase family)